MQALKDTVERVILLRPLTDELTTGFMYYVRCILVVDSLRANSA